MKSPKSYEAELAASARDAFASHAITSRAADRWVIRNPTSSCFWAEIVVLRCGKVLVHGDTDIVCFASYNSETAPESVVAWVAESNIAYLANKVEPRMIVWEEDEDVAEYQIFDALKDREDDGVSSQDAYVRGYKAALSSLQRGYGLVDAAKEIYDVTGDSEASQTIGHVIAPKIFFAHAAVTKLHALLDAEST